jgi:hypothetical protein
MKRIAALSSVAIAVWLVVAAPAVPRAQESAAEGRRRSLDQILDLYVRDGWVYYRALKLERGKLDGFLNQIGGTDIARAPRPEQLAFWLNAYDALVLKTVIDHYPIQGHTSSYPSRSIRQIPGAFEQLPHRVALRTVTLDQIEKTILAEFGDPRVYLAIGRGSVGGGRLRSEAFTPARLEEQLAEAASECAKRPECVQIDRSANKVLATPVFSWREKDFSEKYAAGAPPMFANRSPIERAILAFVQPNLLNIERDFLQKNAFEVVFKPFDWSLNDLTGRGGR